MGFWALVFSGAANTCIRYLLHLLPLNVDLAKPVELLIHITPWTERTLPQLYFESSTVET